MDIQAMFNKQSMTENNEKQGTKRIVKPKAHPAMEVLYKAESDAAEMKAQIARLMAENEALKKAKATNKPLTCKVSTSGALSVYGLGRFPVTLYASQWAKLLPFAGEIEKFAIENANLLKVKE